MKILVAIIVVFMFSNCPSPAVCTHLETRCADDVAQLCDADGHWQTVMDCTVITPEGWHCSVEGLGHACTR